MCVFLGLRFVETTKMTVANSLYVTTVLIR